MAQFTESTTWLLCTSCCCHTPAESSWNLTRCNYWLCFLRFCTGLLQYIEQSLIKCHLLKECPWKRYDSDLLWSLTQEQESVLSSLSQKPTYTDTLPHIGTNELRSNVTGVKTTRANRASQKQKPTTAGGTKHILLRTWLTVLTAVSVIFLNKMILCWRCKSFSVSPSHLFPFCVSALKREDKMTLCILICDVAKSGKLPDFSWRGENNSCYCVTTSLHFFFFFFFPFSCHVHSSMG